MSKWGQIKMSVLISSIIVATAYGASERMPREIGHEPIRPFDAGQSEPHVQRQLSQFLESQGEVCATTDGYCYTDTALVGDLCYCNFEHASQVPGLVR